LCAASVPIPASGADRRTTDGNRREPTGTGLLCRPRARNCLRIDEERPRNDGNRRGPTHPTLSSQGDVTVCQTLLYSGSTPDWLQREFLALCNRSLIGCHMILVALRLGRLLRPLPRCKWQTRRVLSRGRGDTANIGGICLLRREQDLASSNGLRNANAMHKPYDLSTPYLSVSHPQNAYLQDRRLSRAKKKQQNQK